MRQVKGIEKVVVKLMDYGQEFKYEIFDNTNIECVNGMHIQIHHGTGNLVYQNNEQEETLFKFVDDNTREKQFNKLVSIMEQDLITYTT